jgi:hypothetical protein
VALRLSGAASFVRKSLGAQPTPSQKADLTEIVEEARRMVGSDADRLSAEGASMALEVVMQYALDSAVS